MSESFAVNKMKQWCWDLLYCGCIPKKTETNQFQSSFFIDDRPNICSLQCSTASALGLLFLNHVTQLQWVSRRVGHMMHRGKEEMAAPVCVMLKELWRHPGRNLNLGGSVKERGSQRDQQKEQKKSFVDPEVAWEFMKAALITKGLTGKHKRKSPNPYRPAVMTVRAKDETAFQMPWCQRNKTCPPDQRSIWKKPPAQEHQALSQHCSWRWNAESHLSNQPALNVI